MNINNSKFGIKFCLWAAVILTVCGYAPRGITGTLSIETKTSVSVTDDRISITVTATNRGTETAHDVQIHLIFPDHHLKGRITPLLKPGESGTDNFTKTLSNIRKGRYPLTVQVDFHDSNNYPFSALSGRTFFFREDVSSDVGVLSKNTAITGKGKISFALTNLGDQPKKIQATLILPKELSTPNTVKMLDIAARSKTNVLFPISSFSELKASYPVFCYFEYNLGDFHYTTVSRSVVSIEKPKNWFRRTRLLWIALGCIMAGGFVILLIKNRKTGATSS
ncbi:CARDB domain-containing protein [Thermodesulfobacteriota bacterium]